MALELMNDHEQSELVRNWLRQNVGSILVGVLIGLGLIVGWQQWQRMQRTQAQQAQIDYRELVKAVDAGKPEDAAKLATTLRSDHAKSAYASLSALRDAADAVKRGELDAAATSLEWARADTRAWPRNSVATPWLRWIARPRRAVPTTRRWQPWTPACRSGPTSR
jgi:predicted negative regulator of RcsB-dependent stress response